MTLLQLFVCVCNNQIWYLHNRIMKIDLTFPSSPNVSMEAKHLITRVSYMFIELCEDSFIFYNTMV